jgi:hypothetical protein
MADFKANEPVKTVVEKVSVDKIGGAAPGPGQYNFSLVVTGDNGVESAPTRITVTVIRLVAALAAVNDQDVKFADNTVIVGQKFSLSASGSEGGGAIKGYRFTLEPGGRDPDDI